MSGISPNTRKPSWLKIKLPTGERQQRYARIKARSRELGLSTVCEEAQCPNIGECWGGGTATFMVMGSICTRGCRFCAVNTSRNGAPLDPEEPHNVAVAISEMELDYVVVTSVDRDDIEDGGAAHFAACIQSIHELNPKTLVEVLIPDFCGNSTQLGKVVQAKPEVLAHNIECIERLTPRVRDPRASYKQSLEVLAKAKSMGAEYTKSSIMVGLGESYEEVLACMRDLRAVDVDFLTIGQYLRPSGKHLALERYVTPAEFEAFKKAGLDMGFAIVASGPLVRSSYKAGEFFIQRHIQAKRASS
jgi:lipoic acid synthetase